MTRKKKRPDKRRGQAENLIAIRRKEVKSAETAARFRWAKETGREREGF
jgi:hypothetical protein